MRSRRSAQIIRFHRDRISRWGDGTLGALGWRAPASQGNRFDVIAEVGDMNDRSVLDLGCGRYGRKLCMGRMKQAAYPWWT
ncbi:hypothetical protein HOK31_28115 [Candidatus Poribacteria bacterium]|nr:hypothetical protein [Candidatus Poribacteria bacterium]